MRPCGECQACCETLAFPSIGKKLGERCWHQKTTAAGAPCCSVYIGRPMECRHFDCLWRRGDRVPEGDRPDHSGVLADLVQGGILAIREVYPGAFGLPAGSAAARRLIEAMPEVDGVAFFPFRYIGEAEPMTREKALEALPQPEVQ